jgi:hypothetical protein
MKKSTLLIIALMLLVVLVVAVAAEIPDGADLPPGADQRLAEYIGASFPPGTVTMQAAEQAARPWNFGEEMSHTSFGSSMHFQTDTGPTHTQRLNLSTLYYPPVEVWCLLLEREEGAETSYAVVFLAQHVDLHNGDWVIHEIGDDLSSPQFRETLSALGCDLGLLKAGPHITE